MWLEINYTANHAVQLYDYWGYFMSDNVLEYDITILCDEDPKSRRAATLIKRKISSFVFCTRLHFGGALFCPGQVTDTNFNTCLNGAVRSKFLIAVLSYKSTSSSAVKAATLYAAKTGRKALFICSDIASLKKARESCLFEVDYTSTSFVLPILFNPMLAKLKSELTEQKWSPAKQKRLKIFRILATAAFAFVFLFMTVGVIRLVNDRRDSGIYPEMKATILIGGSKCIGTQFLSEDGQIFGDLQMDGKLLVRRTEDNTILQVIDTSFEKTIARTIFTKDHNKVLVYNSDDVVLYDIGRNKELFRFPLEHDRFMTTLFTNNDEYFAVGEGNGEDYYKVTLWNTDTGGLLCSYLDGDGFVLRGITSDGRKIVALKGESYIWTWDLFDKKGAYGKEAVAGIEEKVDFWPFSPDGRYYVDSSEYKKQLSDTVVSDIGIYACSNGSKLSNIQFSDKGFSHSSFDSSGRLLVTKSYYFAIYDPFSGALSFKIPARKNIYFREVCPIKDTRFAFCYSEEKGFQNARLFVIDTTDGKIVAERLVKEWINRIQLFPETKQIIATTEFEGGRSAMLFRYKITEGGIEFED